MDNSIYFGVKTGCNAAFIVDESTRQSLIAEDPNSSDLLKPVLRGRDIRRYQAQWNGLWLIDTHNGYGGVPPIDVQEYPAIKAHLDQFYLQLERRHDKGISPYNLRNCAYHAEFSKEKIVWIELVERGRFAYETTGKYAEASAFMMVGEYLKYICGLMNTNVVRWFLQRTAPTSGMGTLRWKKAYIEAIPIPRVHEQQQMPVINLVNQILSCEIKRGQDSIDELERNIEQVTYELYGLNREEVAEVELVKKL